MKGSTKCVHPGGKNALHTSGLHLMQQIHCLYQAHITFFHFHFGSFTITEDIWHLMPVDQGYLILLIPCAKLLSCQ